MANELTVQNEGSVIETGFTNSISFEFTQRAAGLLSKSSLVPKEYQNNIPNCVIALNMASRMGADPFMVMQNLYIVNGRPGWSSQFLIATFNTSGNFSALRYEWVGVRDTDSFGCRAWATEKSTGEKLVGSSVTIAISKKEGWYAKNGSKWQTMPEQMLMYRAASWFVRAYSPELAMGMHTQEELVDIPYDGKNRLTSSNRGVITGDIIDASAESSIEAEFKAEQAKKKTNAELDAEILAMEEADAKAKVNQK